MGALSLHSFTADYIERLHKAGAPADLCIRIESFLVAALESADRQRRADWRMGTMGAKAAASEEGVCENTIRYRARCYRRKSKVAAVI